MRCDGMGSLAGSGDSHVVETLVDEREVVEVVGVRIRAVGRGG